MIFNTGGSNIIPFGVCSTAAGTAAKTVTVSPAISSLTVGQLIFVRFDAHNEANAPTLNVNGLGAKNIANVWRTPAGPDTSRSWQDGQIVLFRCTMAENDVHWEKMTQPYMGLFVDNVYPVGSIYMSISSTSPATMFGGTWTRIKDAFLWAMGDSGAAGDTGGSATVTLTENNIPPLRLYYGSDSGGGYPAVDGSVLYTNSDTNSNFVRAVNPYISTPQSVNIMPPHMNVYCWRRVS